MTKREEHDAMQQGTLAIDLDKLVERFCRYVRIDTQSAEESESYPSTAKQLDLCRLLCKELQEMGLTDAEVTEHGYVFATLQPTTDRKVPVLGLIAHVDTSPEVSGAGVVPVIHRQYQGEDIILPGDTSQVIRLQDNPDLAGCLGHDIITSDGTTLLGADNKAGVAEIMTAVRYLIDHPEVPHGPIRIAFTVDEEVGTGTKHFDLQRFGAEYAYTIDGGAVGEIEDETFSADSITITLKGRNVHPGYAKGKMVNSMRVAADFIAMLPCERMNPETTEGREGYLHLHTLHGAVESTELKMLVRDFTTEGLKEKEELVRLILATLKLKYPRLEYGIEITESYRNMKYILDQYPQVTAYAVEAITRAGLTPKRSIIRGGTDGSRLSAMGLPTPNIFTGGHNFHARTEWVSAQDMMGAVSTIVHLAAIWAEKSSGR